MKLILAGPLEGATIELAGVKFENGEAEVPATVDGKNLALFLGRCWQAFPEGSDDLERVRQVCREAANGVGEVQQATQPGAPAALRGDVRPQGEGPEAVPAEHGQGAARRAAGDPGVLPAGNGHADPRVPPGAEAYLDARLHAAVMGLDPLCDTHWTRYGKPSLEALAERYGSGAVTRKMVEDAAPGHDREAALELAAAQEAR